MCKRFILSLGFIALALSINAQGLTFGLRAGLNYSKFQGPQMAEESYSLNNGFHFGINVGYKVNDLFFVRTEILYNQMGSNYDYSGDGYYIFNLFNNNRFVLQDSSNINLDISNAYVSFPITAHISLLEKWEIHGGAYINFLISPVGAGKWRFGSRDAINHQFEQGLNFDYDSDRPGQAGSIFTDQILLIVDDQDASVPSLAGAYYLFREDRGDLYRRMDYGFTGGISYFLNRGLYLGIKAWYGLRDITNNNVDYSFKSLNTDGSFKFSDDFDRNFSIDISLGFKF